MGMIETRIPDVSTLRRIRATSELLDNHLIALANQLKVSGKLTLDAGAVRVLQQSGSSLLAVGVTQVEGRFMRGEVVACVDPNGREVARGLVNYDASEARKIRGQPSSAIEKCIGYVDEPELIHRDNLVLL